MKTIVILALCMLYAAVSANLYDRRGIGGIGGIGGPIVDNWGVGGGIGIGSTYCPSSYCWNGQCSRFDRYAYYLGQLCYCTCGQY